MTEEDQVVIARVLMAALDAHHDGKISCGECGVWVYGGMGAIDYSPRHDAFLCVNCKDDERKKS